MYFIYYKYLSLHVAEEELCIQTIFKSVFNGVETITDEFSNLDVNSDFWKILLVNESRPLTTSITLMGRCFFNKLAFSKSSILKLFQNV